MRQLNVDVAKVDKISCGRRLSLASPCEKLYGELYGSVWDYLNDGGYEVPQDLVSNETENNRRGGAPQLADSRVFSLLSVGLRKDLACNKVVGEKIEIS